MPTYMKFGTIKGDVDTEGYKDWINLLSVSFGTGRNMTQAGGSARNREAGKAIVSEISCVKELDESSVPLFQEAVRGKGTECKLDFTTVQADKLQPYLQVTLKQTQISSMSYSQNGDSRPVEQFNLNFIDIEMKYTSYNEDGVKGQPVAAGYDLATTKPR